jgi:hypothetical protein
MYGPPLVGKSLLGLDESSLRKCIRPLASKVRLHPGHDEIRARRSYQVGRTVMSVFLVRLTVRRSTVSSSSRGSLANSDGCSLLTRRSGCRRLDSLVSRSGLGQDDPGDPGDLVG